MRKVKISLGWRDEARWSKGTRVPQLAVTREKPRKPARRWSDDDAVMTPRAYTVGPSKTDIRADTALLVAAYREREAKRIAANNAVMRKAMRLPPR
jgi:hypothetical protein